MRSVDAFPRRASAARKLLVVAIAAVVAIVVALMLMKEPDAPVAPRGGDLAAAEAAPQADASASEGGDSGAAGTEAVAAPADDASAQVEAAPSPTPVPTPSGPVDVFTGRVLAAADDAPIAGARVALAQANDTWFAAMSSEPKPVITVETDDEGKFRVEYPAVKGLPFNVSMLIAEADGFAQETAVAYGKHEPPGITVDFRLEPGTRIAGWVIDTEDHPVAGATVGSLMLDMPDMSSFGGSIQFMHSGWATTGGNGGFEISAVPAGAKLKLPARAAGYVTAISDEVDAGATDVRIVLAKGGASIVGDVVDADGKPVAGVRVVAMYSQNGGMSPDRMREMFARMSGGIADAQGKFRFDNLAAGPWMIQAIESKPGGGNGRMAMQNVELGTEGETQITLRFEKPVIFVGRAIDSATEEGIAGVRIGDEPFTTWSGRGAAKTHESETRKEVVTGSDGKFRIEVPASGHGAQWVYYKVPDGWIAENRNGPGAEGMHYVQGARGGEETMVELRFTRGVVLAGRVTKRDGSPVADATVRCTSEGSLNAPVRSADTDANGEYKVSVEPASLQKVYVTSSDGWASGETDVPSQGEPARLDLVLEANGSVAGRVMADGKPLAGVAVSVNHRFGNTSWQEQSLSGLATDADGTYTATNVAGGKITVSVQPPTATEYAAPKPQEIELAAGEQRTGVDFAMGEGDVIEGVVSDEDGKPIEGASVQWHIYDGTPYRNNEAKTDAEGYYRIAGLRENAVINHMNVDHPDYDAAYRQNVTVLDGAQNFTLKRRSKVTLLAVDAATGSPVVLYEYAIGDPGTGSTPTRVSNPEGKATLDVSLASGEARVYVAEIGEDGKPTGKKGSEAFGIAGDGKPVEIVVKVGGRTFELSGTVVMQDSEEPVADALVAVFKDPNRMGYIGGSEAPVSAFDVPPVKTDARGRFTLAGLLEGQYELTATKEGLAPVSRPTVAISADEAPKDAVIRMAAHGTVFGQALDRDRKPIAGGTIQWWEQNPWRERTTTTDAQGNYRIENLKPGGMMLSFRDPRSGLQESGNVDVKAGEEVRKDFDFSDTVKLTGTIRVNGEPWNSQAVYFNLIPESGSAASVVAKGNGAYEAYPRAGSWKLSLHLQGSGGGTAARFELAAEPREQAMDFDVTTVPADVVVEVPEGMEFANGYLQTRAMVGDREEDGGTSMQLQAPRKHLPMVIPGRLKATFRSYDGQLVGESEWTDVAPGADNVIVVFAANAAAQREELRSVQQALRDLGFDPGPIDGIMGPLTAGALKRFQEAHDLPATGQADDATKAKLRELGGGG